MPRENTSQLGHRQYLRACKHNGSFEPGLGPQIHMKAAIQRGPLMSEDQSDKVNEKGPAARYIALLGAGATTLAVLNIVTNGAEALSPTVMMLQYAALAGGLFALVGGLTMMATAAKE
jgi:hypothetical protein